MYLIYFLVFNFYYDDDINNKKKKKKSLGSEIKRKREQGTKKSRD